MRSKPSVTGSGQSVQSQAPSASIFFKTRGAPMQRSSESIANLAAALARAQGALINPEKTLTARIKADGSPGRIFRDAPLSSGLDIIRKTLGQYKIAVVQTTSTDASAGMIHL